MKCYGEPDCVYRDHDHDASCYPRLRAYPPPSSATPQQRAARESVRARRLRAFERDQRAVRRASG